MGTLVYGAVQRRIVIEDRLLAHLEIVALSRLRRNNAFALRWSQNGPQGDSRRVIWVHHSTDLCFEFDSAEPAEIDRELLDELATAADSNSGINLKYAASDAGWADPQ